MKAIIALDSFKGCLTAEQAGAAALKAFPEGEAVAIPVSDGGEGFTTIMTEYPAAGLYRPDRRRGIHPGRLPAFPYPLERAISRVQ